MLDRLTGDAAIIRRQQERIDELEETIRQMREEPPAPARFFPFEWGIKPVCSRMLWALYDARGGFVSAEQMVEISGSRSDADAVGVMRVHLWNLRKRLQPLGVEITNRYGFGYQLPPKSRAIIKAKLEESQLAA